MSTAGVIAVVVTLVVATGVGLWLRSRDGRVRSAAPGVVVGAGGWALAGATPGDGHRALLLQLSSPVCTPCRRTAETLTALGERRPDLRHVELDVADRPDVARELGVMRTPTVVAFDRGGAELLRVSGVPVAAELEASLDAALARPRS